MTHKPLKIWYISKYVCPPTVNGTGSRGFFLMDEIARLGNDVSIVTSDSNHLIEPPKIDGKFLHEKISNINLFWLKTLKYSKTNSLRRILSWLSFEKNLLFFNREKLPAPDIIIVSSLSLLTLITGVLFKFLYKAKLVVEIRDIWPLTLTEEGGYTKYNPLIIFLSFIEKFGYYFSDLVIGTMPNLKEHVSKLGINANTKCIPMGFDQNFMLDQKKLSSDFVYSSFPRDKFIIGHVGSVGITNALDHLFLAAKNLEEHEHIHFIIVGEGDLVQHYQSKYNAKNVSFIKKVSKNKVQDLLSNCDILYFSTFNSEVWRYGQSLNKLIDYMYSGKPILATFSGFPSMVNESMCGALIQHSKKNGLEEKIIEYSKKTKDELNDIGIKGKKWLLENRKYSTLGKKYLKLLLSLKS